MLRGGAVFGGSWDSVLPGLVNLVLRGLNRCGDLLCQFRGVHFERRPESF